MKINKIKLFNIYKICTILCLVNFIIQLTGILFFIETNIDGLELYNINIIIHILFYFVEYFLYFSLLTLCPLFYVIFLLFGESGNIYHLILYLITSFVYLEFFYLFIGSLVYLRWHRSTTPAQRKEYYITINKKLTKKQLWYYILNLAALCCPILLVVWSSFGLPSEIFIVPTLVLLALLIFSEIKSFLGSVTIEEKKRYKLTIIASVLCFMWNILTAFFYIYLGLYGLRYSILI